MTGIDSRARRLQWRFVGAPILAAVGCAVLVELAYAFETRRTVLDDLGRFAESAAWVVAGYAFAGAFVGVAIGLPVDATYSHRSVRYRRGLLLLVTASGTLLVLVVQIMLFVPMSGFSVPRDPLFAVMVAGALLAPVLVWLLLRSGVTSQRDAVAPGGASREPEPPGSRRVVGPTVSPYGPRTGGTGAGADGWRGTTRSPSDQPVRREDAGDR